MVLSKLPLKNLLLLRIIDEEVEKIEYGQITFTMVLKDGVADIKTLNIVRSKRIRYPSTPFLDKEK